MRSRLLCAAALALLATLSPLSAQDGSKRALRVLEDPGADTGSLRLLGGLRVGSTAAGARGLVEVLVPVTRELRAAPNAGFQVTLVLARIDEQPVVLTEEVPTQSLADASAWLYQREIELPEDFLEMAVTVSLKGSGLWGAALVEFGDEPLPRPFSGLASHTTRLAPEPTSVTTTRSAPVTSSVIRVLPPRERPATGRTRFQTLTSVEGIERVDFLLDEAQVESDERAPFTATIDLGPTPQAHQIEAIAYSASGREIGRHSIVVNDASNPFRVEIAGLDGQPESGSVGVRAVVSIPPATELDRVEFFWNDELGATIEKPPFEATLTSADPQTSDFIRVVAHLTDGTANEDAWLLSAPGPSERIDVNLVEIYVVATDSNGAPVEGLGQDDFEVVLQGKPRPIETFGLAEERPLVLGVVIDTSESMYPLMLETKQAGAQFLLQTIEEEDRAFLVDFDTKPRLAHGTTDDVAKLLRAFGRLEADGFTALYDAIIFALLQLEESEGRKALVLLTDGDDYRSEFNQKRCIEYGQDLGVPVYIISLTSVYNQSRNVRKTDLEGITEATGGRIFYIREVEQLGTAYAQINDELRKQYLLTFTTERQLSTDELRSIKVKSKRKGLTVRAAVAGKFQ